MAAQGIPAEHRRQMIASMRDQVEQRWRETVLAAFPRRLAERLDQACAAKDIRAAYEPGGDIVRYRLGPRAERAAPYLEKSVASWWRKGSVDHIVNVVCWPVLAGDKPTVVGMIDDAGGTAVAILEFSWSLEVEERDIALVDGCFVVDLLERPRRGDELHVLACRWERCSPTVTVPVVAPATVARRSRSDWHLHWD